MEKNFKLTQAAVNRLAEKYDTPLLVLSESQIEYNYNFLKERMPGIKIYYAVKSNPHERIIRKLNEIGSGFEVASGGEISLLNELGIPSERIVYANTVKTARGLEISKRFGVNKFTFDSESEIVKMAKAVPGGTVLLRIRVDNSDALIDLNKKFGAPADKAMHLLKMAASQGLDVAGLAFHVGSQSTNARTYLATLKICRKLFDEARKEGINLRILDIGGGFPIPAVGENIDIGGIVETVGKALSKYFPDAEVWCEPGRFICGTAVNLIVKVIGVQERDNNQWYFLDDGLYGTFSGVIFDKWNFEIETFKKGEEIPATFAGPSCDSIDIVFPKKMTAPLDIDDLILVPNCGAYTSASATTFNGFAKTPFVVWEDAEK